VSTTARAPRGVVVRTLLFDAIDYAGLFPPAQLDMAGAVAEYAAYLESGDAWALGRFVLPATRLEELSREAAAHASTPSHPAGWRLSVVLGADIPGEAERVKAFNAAHESLSGAWSASVEAVELKAATPQAIGDAMRVVPEDLERYVEIPIADDPSPLVRAIAAGHAFAKVRTGGTTPDAFPKSDDLARFLAACVAEGVPFKATAGLHHPLRGDYPLTYEPGSVTGRMYGFLNVFLATAFLRSGMSQAESAALLEERDASAIVFDDDGVRWRGHRLTVSGLEVARAASIQSFGSCSFREPIDDLTALDLL
jgi:hypothetical protein